MMFNSLKMISAILFLIFFVSLSHAEAPISMWSDTTHNTINLGWTDSSDETAYKIYSVGNPTPLATLAQDTTSYTVTDIHGTLLTPVTSYSFRITAIIGGVEVDNPYQEDTIATTTHFWNDGPFKACVNAYIPGNGPTETPYKSELESLDSSQMINCHDSSITDISPIADLKNIMAISLENNLLNMTTVAPLGNLTQLGTIILAGNDLSGPLPSWIENMPNLSHLDISNNHLTGSIPSWIVDLSLMMTLQLNDNELTGSIPTNIGNWTQLYALYLHNNNLTGVIPSQIGIGTLSDLWLQNNALSGSIPSTIADATNLFSLNLSNNQLSGTIPATIDNLSSLGSIDLSHNQLSGAIPDIGVASYPSNGINLSYNQLTGTIPASLGNIVNLRVLHLSNNYLSGEIPGSLTQLSNINPGDLSMNYNCDLFTDSLQLKTYLDGTTLTGYDGIVNTNGNCGKSVSPALIMYLMD